MRELLGEHGRSKTPGLANSPGSDRAARGAVDDLLGELLNGEALEAEEDKE